MNRSFLLCALAFFLIENGCASVFMPHAKHMNNKIYQLSRPGHCLEGNHDLRLAIRQQSRRQASSRTAMAIPGYGIAEQVFVGGFQNFLSIYNLIITTRILLSWFPQAQGVAALQPIYAVTDPYLNLFRGLIPPLFGLDFSPVLAFFLLNFLTNATAAVGYEMSPGLNFKVNNLEALGRTTPRRLALQAATTFKL